VKIGYMYRMHVSPPKGGNHVHALELVQGFLKEGHEVHLLEDPTVPGATSFPGTTEDELEAFVTSVDVLYIRVDARHLGKWPAVEPCMRFAGDRPVVWEINAPANESLAFSWLGGRRLNVKESFFRKLKRRVHALRQMPGIWKEERLRKRLGERVDAAICVSTALQGYAQKTLGIDNAIVLPNGGPLISEEEISQRRAKRSSEQFTVFYSGSAVYPWQGLDYFSAAIELARERAPDIKFVLAVNQLSEAVPEGPNVEVRQGLNREEILDAICASDACVALHPEYFWSPYRFHGSPMKLFEYMACGTAVVTSNRGQMNEIIEHGFNGMLVSDEPSDILDKLIMLKKDSVLRDRVASGGLGTIKGGRSWKDNVNVTLDVFLNKLN
jgi:glycosyltransferase involved in cell wall biosynthesis